LSANKSDLASHRVFEIDSPDSRPNAPYSASEKGEANAHPEAQPAHNSSNRVDSFAEEGSVGDFGMDSADLHDMSAAMDRRLLESFAKSAR